MEMLLNDIEGAISAGLWVLAVHGAVTIPDICGALAQPDGKTKPEVYKAWFDANLPDYAEPFGGGEKIYRFRCTLLHQGITAHPDGFDRVLFLVSSPNHYMHRLRMSDVLIYDAPTFCRDMTAAARAWLQANKNNYDVRNNLEQHVTVHPNGYPPAIVGVPVFG